MPPNFDDNLLNRPSSDIILFMAPLLPNGPLSDDDSDGELNPELEDDDFIGDPTKILIPLEHNLRALLVKVTGTEGLNRVTQVKLRVIARDVPLQHLSVYIPTLRELILDGSVVSSFRDLGCSLKNLKILRVNRCGIEFLDNMLGLESLEELYVADNLIENCMPLAFLTNVKIVDLRRNRLKNMTRTLTFLTICEKLEHIYDKVLYIEFDECLFRSKKNGLISELFAGIPPNISRAFRYRNLYFFKDKMYYEFDDISNTLVKSDKFDLTVFDFKCGLVDQIIKLINRL